MEGVLVEVILIEDSGGESGSICSVLNPEAQLEAVLLMKDPALLSFGELAWKECVNIQPLLIVHSCFWVSLVGNRWISLNSVVLSLRHS